MPREIDLPAGSPPYATPKPAPEPPVEAEKEKQMTHDVATTLGYAYHDLLTSMEHKMKVGLALDDECADVGRVLAVRLAQPGYSDETPLERLRAELRARDERTGWDRGGTAWVVVRADDLREVVR